MSDYQTQTPKKPPETPPEARSHRDPAQQQQTPSPEFGRHPRFVFDDFASI